MRISLVTSNLGKLQEFRSALASLGIEIDHSQEDCDEIQADSLNEVVLSCLDQLKSRGMRDIVIDDSGLFIHALNGFPGVYSSYALRTLGMEGVLRLLEGIQDRSAHFECCIGASVGGEEFTVTGRCDGSIAFEPSGHEGFGFDPIFVPSGFYRTFAEISITEKNGISHRGRAIQAFAAELRGRIDEAPR
ncbi:MAG: RdgB/HAM1 family non-canonical purine NTP pyrophosphatase [Methanomassiliicoccus sp.]|nr:RdgB/HAM1 family non-canonical purine NTP pyrophosphatase [Methanomassiliicoccus sp.]